MPAFRTLLPFAAIFATAALPGAEDSGKTVEKFLSRYCLECHDADTKKGDRSFEKFTLPLKTLPEVIEARDIIDQLTLREMPPKKADQPTDEERLAAIRALRAGTAAAQASLQSTGSRTVLRRLSNREYENTLTTLFGRRVDTLGLTAEFPKEKTARHLDTIGQSLVTSSTSISWPLTASSKPASASRPPRRRRGGSTRTSSNTRS